MAWNRGNRLKPYWIVFDWRKSVLARHEFHGMKEVNFDLPGMAWNIRSWFWSYWNGSELMEDVGFGLT
jgi:hypothetical protein